MCLAIPGKIIEIYDRPGIKMAKVAFEGITRMICLEYVPEAKVGDYALVHVGFAISLVDEEEARRTYELLKEMGELDQTEPGVDEAAALSET